MDLYGIVYQTVLKELSDREARGEKVLPKVVEEEIEKWVEIFKKTSVSPDETIDKEKMYRQVMYERKIFSNDAVTLDDNRDHIEWLGDAKGNNEWLYWKRYKNYLSRQLPGKVVENMDVVTDEILKRIESPTRPGNWDRRGMVVGNIQSGKTSNYIGVICKAVDAGYKVIVVLAGMNNDLRSQTQKRIDRGFLGRDTSKSDDYDATSGRLGVGLDTRFVPKIKVHAVTNSLASGDFKKSVYKGSTISLGGDPVIAVVKKNVTPLRNLFEWFKRESGNGRIDAPLLLIDDEADNASIDTKSPKMINNVRHDDEQDPTAINGLIRKILKCFGKSAYIGYTATPFANIFIYPDLDESMSKTEFGENLYPRSFIVNLHAPSNYLGPSQVFGLREDSYSDLQKVEPLPLIRIIKETSLLVPNKHKRDFVVGAVPDSLKKALYSFILACAVRYVRGQEKQHNSMLVHVTKYVDIQMQITDKLKKLMREISNELEMKTGPQYEKLIANLKSLWEQDFLPTTKRVKENFDNDIKEVSWEEIEKVFYKVAAKIEVKAVNGKAADGGLEYEKYPNGCNVVAVGGDKLSRGLTLEGLSVSYYTRKSKTYDTLLQMGRWFGYRPLYEDVCRLFTTKKLAEWYQHIAVVNEEFRQELDEMAATPGATPENYGLMIRTHPGEMLITAINKMRNSETRKVTYSGRLVQITRYFKNNEVNETNLIKTKEWISDLGEPEKERVRNNFVWKHVPVRKIIDFLKHIKIHPSCADANPDIVSRYILVQNKENELVDWTVGLVSVKTDVGVNEEKITDKITIGMPWRTDSKCSNESIDYISLPNNNLITEIDQSIDLTEEELQKALECTIANFKPTSKRKDIPKKPSPVWIRKSRDKRRALLLIYVFRSGENENSPYDEKYVGYAISFPASDTAQEIDYKVGEVYLENEEEETQDESW